MIEFLYRRIMNNKWLFTCLVLGAIMGCAIFACIPMYSNAILQKVLTRDLENYHISNSISPAAYVVKYNRYSSVDVELAKLENLVQNKLAGALSLPVISKAKTVESAALRIKRPVETDVGIKNAALASVTGIERHVKILHGRFPGKEADGDVYEVMATEKAMKELNLLLDNTYDLCEVVLSDKEEVVLLKVRLVGVFEMKDPADLYWSQGKLKDLDYAFVIDESLLSNIMSSNEKIGMNKLEWAYYFDYYKIRLQDVKNILETISLQERWVVNNQNVISIITPLKDVLKDYGTREQQLGITLWILIIPLVIILCFYTLLITSLIIKNDSNEIAVLKSRGAGTIQIFLMYVIQSVVVAGIAVGLGLVSALFICRVLGASNGFMDFVGRKALHLEINLEIVLYSIAGAVLFMLFMLIPAYNASRFSIVQYKRSRLYSGPKSFWERFYLDIIVLGLSCYGLYRIQNHKDILGTTGLRGTELQIDPLLYFVSTFFILGTSLVFLRIYPLAIRLVFKVGEKWWNPVAYFSLVNVGRSEKNLQFIMLFLILALAFGITNANQARTINRNIEDRVMYEDGADIVIEPYNNLKHQIQTPLIGMQDSTDKKKVEYKEPPYREYEKIEGQEAITKVLVHNNDTMTCGSETIPDLRVMGIIPNEFGQIAWFRNGLLPRHINEYLNLLTRAPKAILLSSNIRGKYDVKVGDMVELKIGDVGYLTFTVYAFIDYFPACNPFIEDDKNSLKYFSVVNYSYLQRKLPSQPYEIWMKKVKGTSDTAINNELEKKKLSVERVDYTDQELIQKKNDPMLQGTNGVLTMCFIITMLITAIGFIIFWTLSLKERALKIGISRAVGMSMREVTMIMVLEQVMVSGCAIAAGVVLGGISSRLFIPLLQVAYSAAGQVPPFKVTALESDYAQVIGIALAMLIGALAALYVLAKRIKVNQVLKLGED